MPDLPMGTFPLGRGPGAWCWLYQRSRLVVHGVLREILEGLRFTIHRDHLAVVIEDPSPHKGSLHRDCGFPRGIEEWGLYYLCGYFLADGFYGDFHLQTRAEFGV